MTKDNLVWVLSGGIIGIVMGVFIANYSTVPRSPGSASTPAVQETSGVGQSAELPTGHPPVDQQAILNEIARQKEILKSDPSNQEAVIAIANLSFDSKNYQEAIQYYEMAIQKDPNNVNLITDLGSCYFGINQYQNAIEYYNRSLAINPTHFQTLLNIGLARMNSGDKEGAAAAWEKIIQSYPDHPDIAMLKQAVQEMRDAGSGT